jgi:integrase/recombinase XerC/integrase/recombinase XerD
MLLDHLTDKVSQSYGIAGTYHLTADIDIAGQFDLFLWSCRANNLSPRTIQDYRFKAGRFVQFCLYTGCHSPIDVTANHVRAFLLRLQEHNCAKSVHDYYRVLKRFFNWMVEEDILQYSPMTKIKPPRVPETIIKPFTDSHIRGILLLCDEHTRAGIRNRAIILMLLDTGIRLNELANIQLADLDLDNETVIVMGKGNRQRMVRIGKVAQKALLQYLLSRKDNHSCLWVTEEGKPLAKAGISVMFRVLKHRAGFQDVRLSAHTFRHTSGTWALLNGASERDVQLLLGHRTERMTRHYTATITSQQVLAKHRQFSPVDRLRLK